MREVFGQAIFLELLVLYFSGLLLLLLKYKVKCLLLLLLYLKPDFLKLHPSSSKRLEITAKMKSWFCSPAAFSWINFPTWHSLTCYKLHLKTTGAYFPPSKHNVPCNDTFGMLYVKQTFTTIVLTFKTLFMLFPTPCSNTTCTALFCFSVYCHQTDEYKWHIVNIKHTHILYKHVDLPTCKCF